MKKILLLFFLLSVLIINAQYQRFVYEYKFAIDSTAKDKTETELMNLDIAPKGSKFYSKDYQELDSLMTAYIQKQVKSGIKDFSLSGMGYKGEMRYFVEKSYPDYALSYFNSLLSDEYLVKDTRKQQWKILSDKEKIGDFNAQKAVCDFAGRKWTAWFTTDIPIQDGPYKFHGLPGLIIKLEDNTHTHLFELKGVKKLPETSEWKSQKEKKRYNALITLDQEKYKKGFKDYLQDPMKGQRQLLSSGTIIEMRDDSGKVIDPAKQMREDEKRLKEKLKKQNNILELDLLQ
ncbi:GLPGLI family protein [Chryseobacterium polytrichastri]|uniref:GLPGLI family protein n=1 Tax=Chryseobacterium polytrichastri TaxID=1302687 RepID=A0A1M6S157_9FLAO|nr:GLPGLI family protein [Chryseobacterium polytrichastri]SHK38319.1 GLPGLI family protein [Chryseobacterium polytrichastri]